MTDWTDETVVKSLLKRLASNAADKAINNKDWDAAPFHAVLREIGKQKYVKLTNQLEQELGTNAVTPLSVAALSFKG